MPSRPSSPTDRNPPTNKALTPLFAHSTPLLFDTGSHSFEPMPWGTPQSSPCDEVGGYFGLDPDHCFELLWTPFDTDFLFESGLEGTPPRLPDVKVVGYSGMSALAGDPLLTHPSTTSEDDGEGSSPFHVLPIMLTPTCRITCICGCGGAPCVKQKPHRRPKGDPLDDHLLGELITFRVHGECGIPLMDAIANKYSGLSGRDAPMFVGSKTSISIRIEWPGCPSWAQQMRTKDWKRKPSPITKAKLATEMAKKVRRFLEDMDSNRISGGSMPPPGKDGLSRLSLVALERVSCASWQPHLRLI